MLDSKSLSKRINENITLNQSILIFTINGLASVLLLGVIAKYGYYEVIFLIILASILWIYFANIAIHKTADNIYNNMQKEAFDIIKKDLSTEFTRIAFVGNNNTSKDIPINEKLNYWAKMDKGSKDVITLKVDDNKGTVIYEEKTKNYVWFIKNFYIYKFFKD